VRFSSFPRLKKQNELVESVVTAHESAGGWERNALVLGLFCRRITLLLETSLPRISRHGRPLSNSHGQHRGDHLRKKEVVMPIPFLLGGLCGPN
jgi:hypothetical protein